MSLHSGICWEASQAQSDKANSFKQEGFAGLGL